jgi:hypothetical protein
MAKQLITKYQQLHVQHNHNMGDRWFIASVG